MRIQESGEMYLESIFLIQKKKGSVRAVDVASFTGYSKPSVSRAMGLLKSADYIVVENDGHILFTESGKRVAETMYERHIALTELFRKLGVPEEIASEDACKIEHVISETSFSALKDLAQTL